ncbi:hypothetical protein U0C82_03175 [Fulvimarina sp. 2208YS6-2-32]|uniref:Glycosyl transferase family 2 n=1 Tax=Fulvimarina uroteuthidis TaxID=3098149 RepID=A0ABU5HYD9_9HYPH|nr:glycosyltransferase [Fulvimarina sp. 2208YS6-2-32]MDY8108150.1 hypothetical protein [Fulvimarina sp. 2208YS6-2-32]
MQKPDGLNDAIADIVDAHGGYLAALAHGTAEVAEPDYIACIPARNESVRVAACLEALDRVFGPTLRVVLLVNDTVDETADIAVATAGRLRCAVTVVSMRWLGAIGSAPRARALAFALAGLLAPRARLFSTDADTNVLPGLREAYDTAFAAGFDMVCGRIGFIAEEAARLPPSDPRRDATIRTYRDASRHVAALICPDPDNPWPHHGNIGGANFAMTARAYQIAGPLPITPFGEDRALRRRFEASGLRISYANEPRVETSCRLDSATEGGLSAELKRNRIEADPLADEALEPPAALLRRLRLRSLVEREPDRARVRARLVAFGLPESRASELTVLRPRSMAWYHAETELRCLERRRLRVSDLARCLPSLIRLRDLFEKAPPGSRGDRAG